MKNLLKITKSFAVGSIFLFGTLVFNPVSVLAQNLDANLAYSEIQSDSAQSGIINVLVNPGRLSAVDFSSTDQVITYMGVGDASRIVYNTDVPLSTGRSQTVFLLPIQQLEFTGATRANLTNLFLKTVDSSGRSRLYNFQIVHTPSVESLGIKIMPTAPVIEAKVDNQLFKVGYNRYASLEDISLGLTVSVREAYVLPNDPFVAEIKKLIGIVRNSDSTIVEIATQLGLNIGAITSLAELGIEERDSRLSISPIISSLQPEKNIDLSNLETIDSLEPKTEVVLAQEDLDPEKLLISSSQEIAVNSESELGIDYVSAANNVFYYWNRISNNLGLSSQEKNKVNRAIASFRGGQSFDDSFGNVSTNISDLLREHLLKSGIRV